MRETEKSIHTKAREATARQAYKAVLRQEHPDIAIAIILCAIDDWYQKGFEHGKRTPHKR